MLAGVLKPLEGPQMIVLVGVLLFGSHYIIWPKLKHAFSEIRRHPFPYNRTMVWLWRAIVRRARNANPTDNNEEKPSG